MRLYITILTLFFALHAQGGDPLVSDPPAGVEYPASSAEITLLSEGNRLPALMYLASGAGPHPTVVLLHGLPGNEKNLDVAQALRRAGFNVLFFHYTGAWGAEGDYSIRQLDDDTLTALAFLRDAGNAEQYRVDTERLSLLGHSLGGYTALRTGSIDPGLRCIAALAPANLGLYREGLESNSDAAQRIVAYADGLFMLRGFSGERMIQQLRAAEMSELDTRRFGPGLAGKTVFLITGESDAVTPPAMSYHPLVEAYSGIDDLLLLASLIPGDHSFSTSRVLLTRLLLDGFTAHCR